MIILDVMPNLIEFPVISFLVGNLPQVVMLAVVLNLSDWTADMTLKYLGT